MTKPVGPICNLDCTYCFYLEKEKLFGRTEQFRMAPDVLDRYIHDYIRSQNGPEISFAWQGGEPTLLGVDFFREVVALQHKHSDGRPIANAIQTNGTLLDDAWGEFLAAEKFLVGISIDGPAELHDAYRVDKRQKPTFERVMRGIEVLRKHQAAFNTLTVVNRKNSPHPLKVYRFLKEIGSTYLQFIPLVERMPDATARDLGLDLATPPPPDGNDPAAGAQVTPWSVLPIDFGNFLIAIFNEWVKQDIGRVFVQHFDVALGNWMGLGSSLCVFAETCGRAVAVEHNGDVYSCDHYVYPHFKLGNLMNTSLGDMVEGPFQKKFGTDKRDTLPAYCRSCEVRFACNGECPKHRFLRTPSGEPGLNYLCAGYKKFFKHLDPYMREMAALLHAGRPAADLIPLARTWNGRPRSPSA
jgi:uncharacterized protein